MQDFHRLAVWQKAHALTLRIFEITEAHPQRETFGLTAHLRRTATNIPLRIAEACGRDAPDFSRCLSQARAGLSELEYLILLARDLYHLKPDIHDALHICIVEVRKMLSGLLRAL